MICIIKIYLLGISARVNKYFELFLTHPFFLSFTNSIGDPNPDSPANPTAAQLFMQNKPEYVKRVKLCVEESYIDDPDAPLDLRKPLENETS